MAMVTTTVFHGGFGVVDGCGVDSDGFGEAFGYGNGGGNGAAMVATRLLRHTRQRAMGTTLTLTLMAMVLVLTITTKMMIVKTNAFLWGYGDINSNARLRIFVMSYICVTVFILFVRAVFRF